MSGQPKIENAPGLVWKPRKVGWEARWAARTDLVQRGYLPKSLRIWCGPVSELNSIAISFIQGRCEILQSEMLVWGRGGLPVVAKFDGTLKSLIACYQTDADSPYRKKLRYVTKGNYDALCKRLENSYGSELIADIKGRHLNRWHEEWSVGGKIAMAHGMVGMLRTLVNFGATLLESDECERIAVVLHRMRFEMAKPRTEMITADQAIAVRTMARRMQMPSIALAQAFQFECILRQKDVIGEWVPITEPGLSDVIEGNEKWLRGLRWEEIDKNLILRHTTSKRQKEIQVDLKTAPMVLEELNRLGDLPSSGPVIIAEKVERPYHAAAFRRAWRKVATACKIPPQVYNMDSRAGAISEALLAGAPMDSVRKSATHSNSATTARYSRGDAEASAEVAQFRSARRNKGGSEHT